MHRVSWVIAALAAVSYAQTQVDLHRQAKNVDFSAAGSTKPFQVGTTLPSTCVAGEMFFKADAAPGQNLFGCVAANTWALEAGGASAGVTVSGNGTLVGTRNSIDFSAGLGVLTAISDTGEAILVQHGLDTAIVQTRAGEQSGRALFCASASSSPSAYTCNLAPTLTGYTSGMVLHWKPDQDGQGGDTTLNVDALGARPVKLEDGITNPSPVDVVLGRVYSIWYDGANFRLIRESPVRGVFSEARPSCTAAMRGRFWYVPGAAGVQDDVSVCAKDASDTFAWRRIF